MTCSETKCRAEQKLGTIQRWYFFIKIVLPIVRKNVPVFEKNFEAVGREFAKCLRSLEQFRQ